MSKEIVVGVGDSLLSDHHTHTHTHIYIYLYAIVESTRGQGEQTSNLDEAVCISHGVSTLLKGMLLIILPPAMCE